MKKNKYYLVAGLIGLFITTVLVSGLASADEKSFFGHKDLKWKMDSAKFEEMKAKKAEWQAVLEAGDYQAWLELVGDKPMAEQITEENFAQFAAMHQLMKDGDREGAKAIADELGLEKSMGSRGHFGMKGIHQKGYDKGFADGQASCQQ